MEQFYLGCDVSKGYCDFILLNHNKQVVESNFQLDDTFTGHNHLTEVLTSFYKKHDKEVIIFAGLESTGGYENNWCELLFKLGSVLNIKITRLNPYGVNHLSKASMKRVTNDKISAINIAEYLINYKEEVSYNKEDYFGSVKRFWKFVKTLKKQKAQLLNHLESLIYNVNPELLSYCKDKTPNWIFELLLKYPTALKLSKAKVKAVSKIPYISIDRATILIERAKNSVASDNSSTMEFFIKSITKQIIYLSNEIKEQEIKLASLCNIPEVDLLKSITGVADYSAIGLMIEIGIISRFSSSKRLASFFGLHPVYKESGDKIGQMRMSKQGRKEPRSILFMVAQNAVRNNPMLKEIYENHVQRGKSKMSSLGIIMHKLLRIIYGILKNNKPFDAEIDKRNRNKIQKETAKKVSKKRRVQSFDEGAPISSRQNKKRKESRSSQNGSSIVSGINTSTPNRNIRKI